MAAKLNTSRDIVKDVGTTEDVKAFDAQLAESKRLADAAKAKDVDTQRINAQSAEDRRIAGIRNANAKEEQRSKDWELKLAAEKAEYDRKAAAKDLPSKKPPQCGEKSADGACTADK